MTDILLRNLPNARLHPIKHCYQPAALDAWLYLVSLTRFATVLIRRRKSLLAHVVVGSRGDRVRAVPILLACSLLRVPVCIQYHKNVGGLIFARGSLRDRVLNRLYQLCDLHIFLSAALRNEFLEMAPKIGRTKVIHNALSDSWMGLPATPLEDRKIDVVFFGRWNAEKGIEVLLEYLRATSTPIRCEIYSDHIPQEKIRNAVVKPWAREEEVRSVLATARLLVLPSYLEAYPTVILEALACGTPFVASNVGGIPDIASESGAGVVVEPGNAAALGTAINMLLGNGSDWVRRSRLGREWLNETCSVQRVLSLWTDAYASIEDRYRRR